VGIFCGLKIYSLHLYSNQTTRDMTKVEFCEKHGELLPAEMIKTNDVLMRVASNLSDTQEMLGRGIDVNQQLNEVKKYLFDYMSVLRHEEQYDKYEKQEMNEFLSHLG